jgi:hypothetical protein
MKKLMLSLLVLASVSYNLSALSCPLSNPAMRVKQARNLATAVFLGMVSVPVLIENVKDLTSGDGDLDATEVATHLAGSIAAAGFAYSTFRV